MSGEQPPYSWTEAEKDPMEGIDTTIPHSARIWNYWLGDKDNYPVDREAGEQFVQVFPGIVAEARANRQFLARAIHYLVTEADIHQFLDIGTGLPTVDTHMKFHSGWIQYAGSFMSTMIPSCSRTPGLC